MENVKIFEPISFGGLSVANREKSCWTRSDTELHRDPRYGYHAPLPNCSVSPGPNGMTSDFFSFSDIYIYIYIIYKIQICIYIYISILDFLKERSTAFRHQSPHLRPLFICHIFHNFMSPSPTFTWHDTKALFPGFPARVLFLRHRPPWHRGHPRWTPRRKSSSLAASCSSWAVRPPPTWLRADVY